MRNDWRQPALILLIFATALSGFCAPAPSCTANASAIRSCCGGCQSTDNPRPCCQARQTRQVCVCASGQGTPGSSPKTVPTTPTKTDNGVFEPSLLGKVVVAITTSRSRASQLDSAEPILISQRLATLCRWLS